jgi:hypothetical protein
MRLELSTSAAGILQLPLFRENNYFCQPCGNGLRTKCLRYCQSRISRRCPLPQAVT